MRGRTPFTSSASLLDWLRPHRRAGSGPSADQNDGAQTADPYRGCNRTGPDRPGKSGGDRGIKYGLGPLPVEQWPEITVLAHGPRTAQPPSMRRGVIADTFKA